MEQRDISKTIVIVSIALLIGVGKPFSIDILTGKWLVLIALAQSFLLWQIIKRRI